MQEIFEFRIPEKTAAVYLAESEGTKLGISRKVETEFESQLFKKIMKAQLRQRELGKHFYLSWDVKRRYTESELERASLFSFRVASQFEPCGEECGTEYDDVASCTNCGAGGVQKSKLRTKERKIPKSKDFTQTIANEIIASTRAVDVFKGANVSGLTYSEVYECDSNASALRGWEQLFLALSDVELSTSTRFGSGPFDDGSSSGQMCPHGDLVGLNILSEVSVKSNSLSNADFLSTNKFIGARRGFLRPKRILLCSSRVRQLVLRERLNGLEFEVARFA
jgi:hypothetical protein